MSHAKLGYQPSSFKRTIKCPGWVNLCKDLPRQKTSKFAAEGTVAHHLIELCLTQNRSPYEFVGKTGWHNAGVDGHSRTGIGNSDIAPREKKGDHFIFNIDDAMAEACNVYVEEMRRLRATMVGGIFKVEEKVNLAWLAPGITGTADHLAIEPLTTLRVDDYKHGAGVPVDIGKSVGDNEQLTIYGLGALGQHNHYGVSHVSVNVVQPRASYAGGQIRGIEYPVADLYAWGQDVLIPAVKRMQAPDAPLAQGSWCRWCPGAENLGQDGLPVCPEIRKQMKGKVEQMFPAEIEGPVVTVPNPSLLSGEKLGNVLDFIPILKQYMEAAEAEARRRIEAGSADAPPNYKLVAGRLSDRKWKDDAPVTSLEFVLGDGLYEPRKLLSPAKMESALKKGGMKAKEAQALIDPLLAERKPGAPTLAPITDPRPALPSGVDTMFEAE